MISDLVVALIRAKLVTLDARIDLVISVLNQLLIVVPGNDLHVQT